MIWQTVTPDDLPAVAREFLAALGDCRVVAFRGHMGAGKTTFIKALCEALGVADMVNSPTFAIVNEYASAAGDPLVYHFDLYRLKSVAEVLDMGAEDYFYSGRYCFIEWPEVAEPLLPAEAAEACIEEVDGGGRRLTLRLP